MCTGIPWLFIEGRKSIDIKNLSEGVFKLKILLLNESTEIDIESNCGLRKQTVSFPTMFSHIGVPKYRTKWNT